MNRAADEEDAVPLSAEFIHEVRLTRYASVARALALEITEGRYPIGATLPTEAELVRRYAVSRHTVRQALRELRDQGLIVSRPGIGTTVRGKSESPRFLSGMNNVADLLQSVDATRVRIVSSREVIADEKYAAMLHCAIGEAWVELHCYREAGADHLPLAYVDVYIRAEYADTLYGVNIVQETIYGVLEKRHGLRIVEIDQQIEAVALQNDVADRLKCATGQLALKITRFFLDREARLMEISIGYYPSDRYRQFTKFRSGKSAG